MRPAASSVDAYLADLPDDQRKALQKLRATIRSAAPKAEETISYSMPMYKQDGQLVAFAAFNNHCSLFVCSGSYLSRHAKEYGKYPQAKSGLHFTPDNSLPATLVKKIVKDRLAENAAKVSARTKKKSSSKTTGKKK
ncbi:MAG: DUF1801 domain-containing protein [bacterium]|nr:DUF1801 domain-containing protein [bacterium]